MSLQRSSNRLGRVLAASVAAATLAAPPALAMSDPGPVVDEPTPNPTQAPVVVRASDEGIDWGSAAIGAGGAGALVVLVSLGGFSYATRDRIRVAR
jgi:hypothetical protein